MCTSEVGALSQDLKGGVVDGQRFVEEKWGIGMIDVTRLNGKEVTINCELIETVEETPDTVIVLTTGKKIIVKESRQTVKNLVKSYKRECSSADPVEQKSYSMGFCVTTILHKVV